MGSYRRLILQSKIQTKIAAGADPRKAFEDVSQVWGQHFGLDLEQLEFNEETETVTLRKERVAKQ